MLVCYFFKLMPAQPSRARSFREFLDKKLVLGIEHLESRVLFVHLLLKEGFVGLGSLALFKERLVDVREACELRSELCELCR